MSSSGRNYLQHARAQPKSSSPAPKFSDQADFQSDKTFITRSNAIRRNSSTPLSVPATERHKTQVLGRRSSFNNRIIPSEGTESTIELDMSNRLPATTYTANNSGNQSKTVGGSSRRTDRSRYSPTKTPANDNRLANKVGLLIQVQG